MAVCKKSRPPLAEDKGRFELQAYCGGEVLRGMAVGGGLGV